MGRLADVIMSRFGFHIREEFPPKAEELSTTAEQILKDNPDRISWDIFNLGTVVVYLWHEDDLSSTKCYYLDKNGGHIGMDWEVDGELVGRKLYALAESGTPTISIKSVVGV